MTLQIHELHDSQCRYVLNDKAPFYCCGNPVRDAAVSYCDAHAARCFDGKGRDYRALVEMIYATEQTIVRV